MLQEKNFLTVKDVAEMLDTEAYVLRFYEKELGLNIKRNTKGHRVYTIEDVELFRRIQDMREQGLQLKAIEGIMHDSNQEAKESYEQLSSIQLAPVCAKPTTSVVEIDITDPDNDKVKQFMGIIKQAVMEGNEVTKQQLKEEVKAEVKEEVNQVVDEKLSRLQEEQDAKNEEYYRKLDETMREVQKMRREMVESKEDEKKQKSSFLGKLFKGKNQSIEL